MFYWEYYAGFGVGRRQTSYSEAEDLQVIPEAMNGNADDAPDLLSARGCMQVDLLLGVRVGARL